MNINVVNLINCIRCGDNHENLEFREFLEPPSFVEEGTYSYFAMCPTLDEPMLMKVVEPDVINFNIMVPNENK